ncbi:MAG: hypothetical protein AB7U85_02605 [Alphaproteobacteria bacterium]
MKNYINKVNKLGAELQIYSLKGQYVYKNKGEFVKNNEKEINGTYIQWQVPI